MKTAKLNLEIAKKYYESILKPLSKEGISQTEIDSAMLKICYANLFHNFDQTKLMRTLEEAEDHARCKEDRESFVFTSKRAAS